VYCSRPKLTRRVAFRSISSIHSPDRSRPVPGRHRAQRWDRSAREMPRTCCDRSFVRPVRPRREFDTDRIHL
jgi:hypothetical protein